MPFVQFVLPLLLASGVQVSPIRERVGRRLESSSLVGDRERRLAEPRVDFDRGARIAAARARVTQADALPDPSSKSVSRTFQSLTRRCHEAISRWK